MTRQIEVKGTAAVAGAFDGFGRDVDDLTETHRRVVAGILPDIARRTPFLTGALAGSWDAGASKDTGEIRSSLSYAGPIEYGVRLRGIVGARMVRDTLESEQERIVAEYEAALRDRVKARGFDAD